jgi:hypothetical protein
MEVDLNKLTKVVHEMSISRSDLLKELLPTLEKMFDDQYKHRDGIEYHVRSRYGKYSIYKWEFIDGKRSSSTLAKGIDRDLAIGMMKLLREPK